MSHDNKVIIQRLYEEAWNQRRFELMDLLLSPSHSLHGSPSVSGPAVGPEVYKHVMLLYTAAYPDLCFRIEEMIGEGEKVACYWTMTGTHRGEFLGIPATGKKVSVEGITIHHVTNGKIMDTFAAADNWSLMQQLGAAPAAGQPQGASAR